MSVIRFHEFELDLGTYELRRHGRALKLERIPLELLIQLLEKKGDLVTREEIFSRVWGQDVFIESEQGINTAIRKIRQVLRDDPERPRFVQTVVGRGYRFVAPILSANHSAVEQTAAAVASSDDGMPAKHRLHGSARKTLLAFACAGIVFMSAIAFPRVREWLKPAPVPRQRTLTGNPADNEVLSAVISPDGGLIAYSDKAGITLLTINSGETRLLPGTQGLEVQAWFPSGERFLAAQATPDGSRDLLLVSLSGAPPRKLREDVKASAVSNDGTRVAFSTEGDSAHEIWLMGAEGEEPHRVVAEAPGDTFMDIAWSSDGLRLVDLRRHKTPESNDLFVETRDLTGGPSAVLLSDPRLSQFGESGLCWLRDGRVIYSLTEPAPPQNQSSIWSIAVDSRTGKALDGPKKIANFNGFHASALSGSADGKRLLYLLYRGHAPLFIGGLEENGTRLNSPRAITSDQWDNVPSAWSPDSDSIFLHSIRSGGQGIYRLRLGKDVPENLVSGAEVYSWVELSPDRKWLLYWAETPARSGPARLLRRPISGGPPQTVLTPSRAHIFHCAAGAPLCVLAELSKIDSRTTQTVFTVFDPIQGRQRQLARLDFAVAPAFDFAISPNGEWIACVAMTNHIKLLHVADGATRDITTLPRWKFLQTITWSADGERLYVSVFSPEWNNLLLTADLSGNVRPLLENRHTWLGHPRASPDGRFLAWHEVTAEQNVGLLEDF